MKREVAKSYSLEKVADVYLAELEKAAHDHYPALFLSEVLRKQSIFFDRGIIEGVLKLLESRNYIVYTGAQTLYFLITDSDYDRLLPSKTSTIEELVEYVKNLPKTVPDGISASIKEYKITGEGARFVRLGQVLDVAGKLEREAESKKWRERWVTAGIAFSASILTMVVKWFFFDNK